MSTPEASPEEVLARIHKGLICVHIGDDFFGNVNITFVDDVEIIIGDGV